MRLTLVTAPAVEPVYLLEAKAHLRVTEDDEDALIGQLITVAREALDGRDGLLGRALIQQTWKLTLPKFSRAIEIPLPPLISVDAISYIDSDGDAQTIDLQTVTVEGIGDAASAILRPASGTSWPSTYDHPEAVAITFTAGYGATAADIPAPVKQALLLDIAHMFENREAVTIGSGFMVATPAGYHDLINDFRLRGF